MDAAPRGPFPVFGPKDREPLVGLAHPHLRQSDIVRILREHTWSAGRPAGPMIDNAEITLLFRFSPAGGGWWLAGGVRESRSAAGAR